MSAGWGGFLWIRGDRRATGEFGRVGLRLVATGNVKSSNDQNGEDDQRPYRYVYATMAAWLGSWREGGRRSFRSGDPCIFLRRYRGRILAARGKGRCVRQNIGCWYGVVGGGCSQSVPRCGE